ncbi:MAG: 4-hydroxy-tetrahydrodipicolinate synthase [Alphaproteobacteria bacterium MarineAlpha3_Bin5]|nr:dihydrodipicolinate synthase family protein [Magnetovibrio sp.]PPR79161.1 MAG: 4-hydroxy-tetrahydrodipicolinate synthase [Alphaproteobacteria bacterium MarineAlpha3_Bin5]
MRESSPIKGVFAPVLTPFNPDLTVDQERLFMHCEWLLSQDCSLAIFGTNSEANSLSVNERLQLLEFLVDRGLEPTRMMPGTGCCSIPETVELTKKAVNLGCSSVLMLPPFYYKGVNDEGLYKNFSEVIQRVGDSRLKIFLYHIPQMSGLHFSIDLIERFLREFPETVVGMKDSSGQIENIKVVLHNFPEFKVFVGTESLLLSTLRFGGAGCISGTANINPAKIVRLFNEWKTAKAEHMQNEISEIRKIIEGYQMIPAIKKVIAYYRNDNKWARVRPPLNELPQNETDTLIGKLDFLKFKIPPVQC